MRLLHVIRTTDLESGGPIEGLLRGAEVHIRDGHTIEVVSLEAQEEVAQQMFPFPVTALGKGIGRYGYNPRLAPWLREQAGRFDAVIVHGLWNYSSLGSWLGLKNHRTPYYIFVHGMMDPWFRGYYPFKHLVKQIYWTVAEGRVLRDARSVLFTAEEEKLRARNVFHGHRYSECVVSYGTTGPQGNPEEDVSKFYAGEPQLKGRRFFLFLSRIHPKKGCDLLIEAFAQSRAKSSTEYDLVIAGPDQVGLVPELKALARRLGVAGRIHWLGMLQGESKWGALRSAEALMLPSHQENFGIVVAEAMACSTPVLISNKVNIWREVEASGGGFAEPDTVDGTRNLFHRFQLLSVEERIAMRNAAKQGFLRHFDAVAAARDLVRKIETAQDECA